MYSAVFLSLITYIVKILNKNSMKLKKIETYVVAQSIGKGLPPLRIWTICKGILKIIEIVKNIHKW